MGIDDSYGIFNVVFFTFYPVFFCLLFVSCSYFCFDLSYQEFILDKLLIGISTRAFGSGSSQAHPARNYLTRFDSVCLTNEPSSDTGSGSFS